MMFLHRDGIGWFFYSDVLCTGADHKQGLSCLFFFGGFLYWLWIGLRLNGLDLFFDRWFLEGSYVIVQQGFEGIIIKAHGFNVCLQQLLFIHLFKRQFITSSFGQLLAEDSLGTAVAFSEWMQGIDFAHVVG